jgi:hypothetical protein
VKSALLALLLGSAGCRWPGVAERIVKGPRVRALLADERAVVLPTEAFGDEFPVEARAWTPTWEDIQRTELLVRHHVRAFLPAAHARWEEYRRQYGGYQGAVGKVLFVNFFCVSEADWQTRVVTREAAGDCYFSLKVDIVRNEVFDLNLHEPSDAEPSGP